MRIAFIEISNFRKLKSVRIDLSPNSTVFVGANNSGKTSTMYALVKFLKKRQLVLDDFTISNLSRIYDLGNKYLEYDNQRIPDIDEWKLICPFMDVWLDVREDELRYVADLIPTLSWRSGLLGIRLAFEPKDIDVLYRDYVDTYRASHIQENLKIWPIDLNDFLHHKMKVYFGINAYILDKAKIVPPSSNGIASPQSIPNDCYPLDFDPFKKLIRVDIISAQRWLYDSDENTSEDKSENSLLATQLKDYYDRQLNPEHRPSVSDLKVISEIQNAKEIFDKQISKQFQNAMKEMAKFGYPGKYNPKIIIEAKAQTSDIISRNAIVNYHIYSDGINNYKLPEKYNGLGYQNLISMSFKLMSFRDSWINGDRRNIENNEVNVVQPLHLVLIEEPEAHLHVQVQQVFIKNAYKILRNNAILKSKTDFCTQMIVSTHSSSIASECEFNDLRYFRRIKSTDQLPISIVVNLSSVFGKRNSTTRFVKRYIKTTHCDLFFADAVILIEGAGERILMPYFIDKYEKLGEAYISVLEIGGRHAHLLKPLIDTLGVTCLIITDLDSAYGTKRKSIMPKRNKGYISSNPTIANWIIKNTDLDYLLNLGFEKKEEINPNYMDAKTRIAYQTPIKCILSDGVEHEFLATTFEDAMAYSNMEYLKTAQGLGLIKKFKTALKRGDVATISNEIYDAVRNAKDKTEFALDILYNKDPKNLNIPGYIKEGLQWLEEEITLKENDDYINSED